MVDDTHSRSIDGPVVAQRRDLPELQAEFRDTGRLRVRELLTPAFCQQLHGAIAGWTQWALVTLIAGKHRNFDAAQMAALDPVKSAEFHQLVATEVSNGFQYLFERYPLYDPEVVGEPSHPSLRRFRDLLREGPLLDLVRDVTGEQAIRFGDGQVTRYRRGHFLTQHTDQAEGKNRVVAYVLGLTPLWSADFGGQLQFVDPDGGVGQVMVPEFNTLCLFKVPQPHLVTAVAPFVTASRLSITGWFRTG